MNAKLIEALNTANKLLGKMKRQDRRVYRLEVALEKCLQVLVQIRYVTWPTEGLGIGLNVVELDEALIEAEQVLPKPPKKPKKKKGQI